MSTVAVGVINVPPSEIDWKLVVKVRDAATNKYKVEGTLRDVGAERGVQVAMNDKKSKKGLCDVVMMSAARKVSRNKSAPVSNTNYPTTSLPGANR